MTDPGDDGDLRRRVERARWKRDDARRYVTVCARILGEGPVRERATGLVVLARALEEEKAANAAYLELLDQQRAQGGPW